MRLRLRRWVARIEAIWLANPKATGNRRLTGLLARHLATNLV